MNRQQRRAMRKMKETEAKYLKHLEKRWDDREDAMLDFYSVTIGLAHHNLYGKNRDEFIVPFIREWNEQVRRVFAAEITYPELQQELYNKTGISFEITGDRNG